MDKVNELNNTVFCKPGVSLIQGIGIIAIRDIPIGTNIVWGFHEKNWYQLTLEEFSYLLPEIQGIILDRNIFNERSGIDFPHPNSDIFLQSFMNHSENPNSNGEYSLRDIKKGEEITEDYREVVINQHPLSKNHFNALNP